MHASVFIAFFSAILSGIVVVAVAKAVRRSAVEWAFATGMTLLAAENVLSGLAFAVSTPADKIYWQTCRSLAGTLLPGVWLFFALGYARGNSRIFLHQWRFVLWAAFLIPLGLACSYRSKLFHLLPQPWRPALTIGLSKPGILLDLVSMICAAAVLMQLERTFRAAAGAARWRIKYRVLGLAAVFGVRIYSCGHILLFGVLDPALQSIEAGTLIVASFLIAHSLSRTDRDVEVYPSNSVLLNSLTAVFAGCYLLLIAVLAKIMERMTGGQNFVPEAILLVTGLILLGALLLSDRARAWLRRFVGRHFQRPQYDYRAIWETFRQVTARHVARPDLCRAVVKLVSDLFQAMSVTLWLVKGDKTGLILAASTTFSRKQAECLRLPPDEMTRLIQALAEHQVPFDLQSTKGDWEPLLKGLGCGDSRLGRVGKCAPLFVRGSVIGVMTMGDRVGDENYSPQDLDLLESVSNEVAESLHSLQLIQDLTHAKQLEAFQTMSAFVAHDLKNTSFKLTLLLENLPNHFRDPDFQKDALQGIAQAVGHLNLLIGQLRPLRNKQTHEAVETDLNEIVTQVVESFREVPHGRLVKDLQPLPKVRVDPGQIRNVVTNLLLNARDAILSSGTIAVQTRLRGGHAVLAVKDDGCGMTSEFIDSMLFRPFQTTKDNGMGIGMFQSKAIVDAHRGRIDVESQPGKGTVFRVTLPVCRASEEPQTKRLPVAEVLAG